MHQFQKRFESDNHVILPVKGYFAVLDNRITALEYPWTKCVELIDVMLKNINNSSSIWTYQTALVCRKVDESGSTSVTAVPPEENVNLDQLNGPLTKVIGSSPFSISSHKLPYLFGIRRAFRILRYVSDAVVRRQLNYFWNNV